MSSRHQSSFAYASLTTLGISLGLSAGLACELDPGDADSTSFGSLGPTTETGGDGDGDGDSSGDGDGDTSGDGDGDGSGDGDGDGDSAGDGDGDTSGDGDGDTSGDGDGDTSGDGDGDPGACPSGGGGGAVGQAPILAPGYPNVPGVIYVPQSYDPSQPMPLMLALHGSGDTAGNFVNLWSGLAESEGFIVLVPESLSGGASWNGGTDTPVIGELLDEVAADWNIDECRVYLTGYSAGAHYGYALGLLNSEYFAALGVQAGSLSYAQQGGIWPNDVPRTIAVSIHHGQTDPYVPIAQAEYARDQLQGAGHTVHYHTHPGGHEVGPGDPAQMWMNLSSHTSQE